MGVESVMTREYPGIVFIVVYFGRWPRWFPAFIQSCRTNPTVDWFFFTDCEIPSDSPGNIRYFPMSLSSFQELASAKTGISIPIENVRKLCDLKPALGHIFEDHVASYDFWGFCDVDIIWGNIRKFMTPALLEDHDVVTALAGRIAGHFTLIRNDERGRLLYRAGGAYQHHFQTLEYSWFDEREFTSITTDLQQKGTLRVSWDQDVLDQGVESAWQQDYYIDRWLYDAGALYQLSKHGERLKEYMYLHFLSWKAYIKMGRITRKDHFYISFNCISSSPSSALALFFNRIRRAVWGFPQRKRYNLWKRGLKKRWSQRLQRWQVTTGRG